MRSREKKHVGARAKLYNFGLPFMTMAYIRTYSALQIRTRLIYHLTLQGRLTQHRECSSKLFRSMLAVYIARTKSWYYY